MFTNFWKSCCWRHWPVLSLRVCLPLQCTFDDGECFLFSSRVLQSCFTRSEISTLCNKWFTAWQTKNQGWQGGSVHRRRDTFIPHMSACFPNGGNSTYLGKYFKSIVSCRNAISCQIIQVIVSSKVRVVGYV